ncbi:MAG: hypothetical protein K6G60_07145 [Lachnospiraceae bacterium]|nr:hypothetical protein [Lachnospiraceae bacterium]
MERLKNMDNTSFDKKKKILSVFNTNSEGIDNLCQCISQVYLLNNSLNADEYKDYKQKYEELWMQMNDDESKERLYYDIILETEKKNCMLDIFLEILPSDKTKKFTETILRFKRGFNRKEFPERWFENKLEEAIRSGNKELCMKTFYTLFTFYHDLWDNDRNAELVEKTRTLFNETNPEHPLWFYARSEVLAKASGEKTKDSMLEAIGACKKCIAVYMEGKNGFCPDYPGIYHAFAELVYDTIELDLLENDENRKQLLELALKAIDKAIQYNGNYAKYYYTKGRLVSIDNPSPEKFKKARELINKAINMEDSKREDYGMVRGNYIAALTKLRNDEAIQKMQGQIADQLNIMKETTEKMNEEIARAHIAINNEKKNSIEMLGFFAGIISIIFVSSQIVLSLEAVDAMIILLAFSGIIMLAFSLLRFCIIENSYRLDKEESVTSKTGIIMIIFSVVIIALAVVLLIWGNKEGLFSVNECLSRYRG